jgi:hypothetical protein
MEGGVTFHDPCRLGRWTHLEEAPSIDHNGVTCQLRPLLVLVNRRKSANARLAKAIATKFSSQSPCVFFGQSDVVAIHATDLVRISLDEIDLSIRPRAERLRKAIQCRYVDF